MIARRLSFVVVSSMIVASCNGPGDCSAVELPGLRVTVVSDANGEPVIGGLRVVIGEGSYTEELIGEGNSRMGANERAGTYDLTVEATGFVTQTIEDVRVREDRCHVIPENLTVELVPAAG